MKPNVVSISLFVVFGALITALYWLRLGGAANELLRWAFYAAAPWFAVVAGVFTLRMYGQGARRDIIVWLLAGMLAYAVAEAHWTLYLHVLGIEPFPSVADLFYLISYPCFLVAVLKTVRKNEVRFRNIDAPIRLLMAIVTVGVAFVVGYFGVYQGFDPSLGVLGNAIMVAYSIGDVVLTVLSLTALVLAWEFRGGTRMLVWASMCVGFTLVLFADIGYYAWYGEYVAGDVFVTNVLESLWIFSYLFFAIAMVSFYGSISRARARLSAS